MNQTSYEMIMNIWHEPDGEVGYYVGQTYKDETGAELTAILAHGIANDWEDAQRQCKQAIVEVL